MGVLGGCHEGKKTPILSNIKCPKCGEIIEVFSKEGKAVEETPCDKCDYVIQEGQSISDLL